MADLFLDDADFGLHLAEPEVQVQLVTVREREGEDPPPPSSRFSDLYYGMADGGALLSTTVPEPLRVRGVGATTVFGLNNHFSEEFPSVLTGKVASEEFCSTMARVNAILQKNISFNLRCLLCGCFCCCCTFGLSLGTVLYLSKRTKSRLEKFLESENWRLYNKLGLNLRLSRDQCDGTNLREYAPTPSFFVALQSHDGS